MDGIIRLAIGLAVGAGVGIGLARLTGRRESPEVSGLVDEPGEPGGLRLRFQRAGEASRSARADREAELREYFRKRVKDPEAFPAPVEPPAS